MASGALQAWQGKGTTPADDAEVQSRGQAVAVLKACTRTGAGGGDRQCVWEQPQLQGFAACYRVVGCCGSALQMGTTPPHGTAWHARGPSVVGEDPPLCHYVGLCVSTSWPWTGLDWTVHLRLPGNAEKELKVLHNGHLSARIDGSCATTSLRVMHGILGGWPLAHPMHAMSIAQTHAHLGPVEPSREGRAVFGYTPMQVLLLLPR